MKRKKLIKLIEEKLADTKLNDDVPSGYYSGYNDAVIDTYKEILSLLKSKVI